MKKWKRVNISDKKKERAGRVRLIVSGFMNINKRPRGKKKIVTMIPI